VVDRRAFLRAAGVTALGGSAMFVAACGGGGGGQTSTVATTAAADVDILNGAIRLENTAIAVYAAGTKLLTGDALAVAKQFFSHEMAHADRLGQAVADLGGTPSQPKPSYASAIGHPKTRAEMLTLAERIETTAIAAYLDAIPKLSDPKLRQTVAAIVTSEAEHVSVLRTSLGLSPAPVPFVRGAA
jgi:bacterioferritin (cytochrome b1)